VLSFDAGKQGDFEAGEAGGIQPVNAWFGLNMPLSNVNTFATTPSTVVLPSETDLAL
jgi:hypothetical protein